MKNLYALLATQAAVGGLKQNTLAFGLESDVQDGKTFKEHEHEFYVEISDFEQLKNAESVDLQEQWNLKIPKTEGNAAKGALRIRQIYKGDLNGGPNQKPQGEAQYVLNTKVDQGPGRRLEVPVPTTVDAFNLFAMLSDSGMIKHRYHFPVDDLVFEVDMYLLPEGGYAPVAKIDLEVKNMDGKIPDLPIKVDRVIKGDTQDKAERDQITAWFDQYFITKNKFDAKAVIALESLEDLSIAQEGLVTVGVIGALIGAALIKMKVDERKERKEQRNIPIEKRLASERARADVLVENIRETYANKEWVYTKFKAMELENQFGSVTRDEQVIWDSLSISGQIDSKFSQNWNNAKKAFFDTAEAIYGVYKSNIDKLEDFLNAMLKTEPNRENWNKMMAEVDALPHPFRSSLDKFKLLNKSYGRLTVSESRDKMPWYFEEITITSEPSKKIKPGTLRPLAPEKIVGAGEALIEMVDFFFGRHTPWLYYHVSDIGEPGLWDQIFYAKVDSYYEKAFGNKPDDTVFDRIYHRWDDREDSLSELQETFSKTTRDTMIALDMWIRASIKLPTNKGD